MKPTFLTYEKPLLTVMIQTPSPEDALRRMQCSIPLGAEAFGLQMESFPQEYHTDELYRAILAQAGDLPVYVTNYRGGKNKGRTDEDLAAELLHLADLGGTLFDVMNDYFNPTPGEFTDDPVAVQKQKNLIAALHAKGAEVLMSCHVLKFIPAEEVLRIALAQRERGADVVKIVTGADTLEQQVENLRIVTLLKEKLDCPFLFLSGGKSSILRRVGIHLGCCMSLCVYEHDDYTTHAQPLLIHAKAVRDENGF